MRGWWKALLAYGAVPVALFAFFAFRDGPLDGGLYGVVALAMLPMVLLMTFLGAVRSGRFLKGLRDAGEVVEVVDDRMDWGGDRTTVVRGVSGLWRVVGVTGKQSRVEVLGPGDDLPWRVAGDERKAARAAVERASTGERASPPPKVVTPLRLLGYIAVFYGVLVTLGLALGGSTGAKWTAGLLAPFFAWLAYKAVKRGRPVLVAADGRIDAR